MMTRSKTGKNIPKALQVHHLPGKQSDTDLLPKSVKSPLQSPLWKGAMIMITEYKALLHHNTWSLVEKPCNEKIVTCQWVFAVKKNSKGEIIRYKARLVARGFSQTAGVDFDQVFSPIVKPVTIRIMISIALSKGWRIKQYDFQNTFFNGQLHETLDFAVILLVFH
ncbi:hypothetical protein AAHE18_08G237600 [Arachis hypogaea]